MLRYWTLWNYTFFMFSKYIPYKNAIKASIITTSLIGGYVINIYPMYLPLYCFNYKIKLPRYIVLLSDMFFHHIPLLYLLTNPHKFNDDKSPFYITVPVSLWYLINKYRKIDVNKIYNIHFKYIFSTTFLITTIVNGIR